MHSCREKTPVATPTPAPARTPCPQGCGKTTFCTHARTHARGFRADEALASRGGGFTAIHSSLNSTHGVRRFTTPLAREKKSSCSCSSAARTFSADCKQQTRFLSSTALARRACSGARARAHLQSAISPRHACAHEDKRRRRRRRSTEQILFFIILLLAKYWISVRVFVDKPSQRVTVFLAFTLYYSMRETHPSFFRLVCLRWRVVEG